MKEEKNSLAINNKLRAGENPARFFHILKDFATDIYVGSKLQSNKILE